MSRDEVFFGRRARPDLAEVLWAGYFSDTERRDRELPGRWCPRRPATWIPDPGEPAVLSHRYARSRLSRLRVAARVLEVGEARMQRAKMRVARMSLEEQEALVEAARRGPRSGGAR